MIFKTIDDKQKEINTLKDLLNKSTSEKQKSLIRTDLKKQENGYAAEKENAYYLDFHFESRERLILLHDIRIEYKGRTAQFDHILIAPLGITILESKSSTGELTINDDNSLNIKTGKYTNTYPNPIEQNIRHEKVLYDFIHDTLEIPARFKLRGGIPINHMVIIHPKTTVTNKKLPDGFERSDAFATRRNTEIDNMSGAKVLLATVTFVTKELSKVIATELIKAHRPKEFDYTQKYKMPKNNQSSNVEVTTPTKQPNQSIDTEGESCPRCGEGKLVKRKRKSKKYADKYESDEFFGCSRYPRCKYTQEL